ncbi:MAG: SurA N-terminal domain-containing protein, partial [Pseudobdellovibrionaceae bacterium]
MTLLKSSLFFIVFSNPFFTYAAPTKVDSILAIVNSEVILESDLQKLVGRLTKGGMVDELVLVDKKPEQIKNDKKAQLNVLINEKILDSEVKRLNLTVTIEKVEQEIRSIAKRNNIARNDLINALKAQGVNVSDYQDFIKTRI